MSILYKLSKDITITKQIVTRFAKIVGDNNPVHLDQQKATKTRFGACIAHGMIGVSYVHALLPPQYTISNMAIKYKKPIYLDEQVSVQLRILDQNNQIKGFVYKNINIQTQNSNQSNKKQVATEITGKWVILP